MAVVADDVGVSLNDSVRSNGSSADPRENFHFPNSGHSIEYRIRDLQG